MWLEKDNGPTNVARKGQWSYQCGQKNTMVLPMWLELTAFKIF